MKKSVDCKEINKKQLKQLPELFSNYTRGNEVVKKNFSTIQEKFKEAQPRICENIECEILNFAYENSDSKSDFGSLTLSEASTSKGFSPIISDLNKSDSHQNVNTFLQQPSEQLSYLADKKADDVKNISCDTFGVQKMSDFFHYPVERIKLSYERKSTEEIESSLNINESLFSDLNFINVQKGVNYNHEEKLYRFHTSKEEPEDFKNMSKRLKKIFKRKMRRCSSKTLSWKSFFPKKNNEKKIKKKTEIKSPDVKKRKCEKFGTFLASKVTVEEDLETKRQLLDFFIYIIYLSVITAIALSMVSSNMFYFTSITTSMFFDSIGTSPLSNLSNNSENLFSRFKTLRESNTVEDFWAFAETTMLDMLYWNFYYSRLDPSSHEAEDDRKMLYENQILGVARLRQVRVRNDSCKIHPNVQRFFSACYFYYSVFTEETKPIKEGMKNTSTATAWEYTEAEKLETSYYRGEISVYGGGGYYLDLAPNKDDAAVMIKELKENFWVSKATRAMFIDFNIYNANANLFCICKIVLEFPPVGGILPVADFHSLKLIRYLNILDFFILAWEILYILFVIYYTWQILRALIYQKLSFFLFFWNYFDVAILILSYIYIFLSLIRYFSAKIVISSLSDRLDEYTEFNFVKNLQIEFNNTIAVLLFFCWIKLFKYFNFNTILLEFKITLARSIKDILGFFPIFLTMFLAFAFLAYLLFGNQVKAYNTLWLSFLTLLQAFLGEFYYTEIVESNRILGPLFYVAYIFFIFFVLLNVFIAIINDAYRSVKSQVIYEKPRTGEYMKRGLVNVFTCGRVHSNKKLWIKETKKKFLFQEIEIALKKAGFSAAEINVFFYKYNINFSNFLEENTKKRVLKDLELKRIDFSETSEQVQINALRRRLDKERAAQYCALKKNEHLLFFSSLTNKMEDLEKYLQPIVHKVDVLLQRL